MNETAKRTMHETAEGTMHETTKTAMNEKIQNNANTNKNERERKSLMSGCHSMANWASGHLALGPGTRTQGNQFVGLNRVNNE